LKLETINKEMKRIIIITIVGCFLLCFSCNEKGRQGKEELTFTEYLEQLDDSTKVGGIVVKNLFKSQILAHKGTEFDSLMIIKKVYEPHRELWDNCYGMIFGEENASKFNNANGMIQWNKTLYPKNKDLFDSRAEELLKVNIDSVLKSNLTKFADLIPYKPEAKISILFTPLQGIGFGGCDRDQFCFELNNTGYDVAYTIEKGIPHELNHLAYEPLRENDPMQGTALFLTIDEGFACYFTWLFFDKKITKYESVENMTEKEWNWFLENEKKIFNELKPFFNDKSGDNPLLRNDKYKLFPDAPKSLNYWLGYRIIESYVNKHGADSWKDIYEMNVQEVFDNSGYEEYIKGLKYQSMKNEEAGKNAIKIEQLEESKEIQFKPDSSYAEYWCSIEILKKTAENIDQLEVTLVAEFLATFNRDCSNNIEYSEWANELLFEVANEKPDFLTQLLFKNSSLDKALIKHELESPIHDGIDLDETINKIEGTNSPIKIKEELIESLKIAKSKY